MQTNLADRIGGLIWFAFGVAIVYGSWIMDRLASLNIPPATAPGVVPGILGICIAILGLILIARRGPRAAVPAFDTGVPAEAPAAPEADEFHWKRVALSWLLCMLYAAVLLGSGVHYWLLTAGFLFLHILLLDESERVPAPPTPPRLLMAAIVAAVFATAVMLVFQHVFLVRLP